MACFCHRSSHWLWGRGVGPVGTGKTTLIEKLCKQMSADFQIAVVTNDIFTKEDAAILTRLSALSSDRIVGVETGGCPHTAIRDDVSANLEAIDMMLERFGQQSGHHLPRKAAAIIWQPASAQNWLMSSSTSLMSLAATNSPAKVAQASPGLTCSLSTRSTWAEYVGASLEVMDRDTQTMRPNLPYLFTDARSEQGLQHVVDWITERVKQKSAMITSLG